jgi:TP901 family phage tail tape measure protein
MAERTVRASFLINVDGAIANLNKLQAKVKDTASNAGKDFDNNKKGVDEFSNTLLKVGATAAIGVGLAVKRFADFDKAMSAVQAATHETTGNMNLLREAAMQAGKDTAFSATEAAQGIENLAKAGVSTSDIIGGGLAGALDLAAAGEISVAEAAETAATAMTQFKLSGKDVPHIADLLAAGAGKAQGSVHDMGMALKQSGLVAAQFGISLEDTTGTLAAFASAGLIGSDAGTSFKTMLIALAKPSKESSDLMRELGINAYDAQGAFIGLPALAEQLKTRLSGLTQEQRNHALAQIFGNDALRAANVLYDQGAAGITDWTTKVNDSGYAAETARIQTDNLTGDVERLGGALDTALIQGGSGANAALRALVQTADSAVTMFANLPPAVSATATALASVAAIGGLGAAGLLKGVGAARDLRAEWTALGRTGRTLTLSMGAIGIALTAAAVVYGVFAERNAEAAQRVDDLKSTLDEQTGAITGNTRAYVANKLAQSGMAEDAKQFGLNLAEVTDAALGNEVALSSVVGTLDMVIAANERYQRGSKDSGAQQQADAAKALRDELLGLNGSLSEAEKQQKLAAEGAKENTGATAGQASAAAAAASATAQQAQQHEAAAAALAQQEQATNALITAMNRMPGLVLSLRDAQRGWFESLESANAALKENGRTLDITTPKGRANQQSLDNMAKSANDVTEAMIRNGSSNRNVVATYEANRAGLIKTAQQFGLTKAQAVDYANKVLAIPKKTNTDIKATITDLQAKLATAKRELANPNLTKERKAQIKANIAQLEAALATARAQLANLPTSKTVTLTTRHITERIVRTQTATGGGRAPTFADGGQLGGHSPHSRADNLLFLGTAKEWVQPVASVNYYGPDFMRDVQTRRFPKPAGYADGGQLGSSRWSGSGQPVYMPAPVIPVTYVTNQIIIGGEVTRVVQQEIRGNNAALKGSVYQKRGR